MQINLETFCGQFEWQKIDFNGQLWVYPDIVWICKFIMLLLIVFYLIKTIYCTIRFFV